MNKVEKYELAEKLENIDLFKTFEIENIKFSSRKDGVHIYNAVMNDFTNEKILTKTQTKKQELKENEYMIFIRRYGNKSIITFLRSWEKTHDYKHLIICWNREETWIEIDVKCPFCKCMRIKCECITKEEFKKENAL